MEPKIFFPADGWFAARQRTMALEFYALGRGEEEIPAAQCGLRGP
jgi:hypothetical protein